MLKNQKKSIGEYWSDYMQEVNAFKTGSAVIGTAWQIIGQPGQGRQAPVETSSPTRARPAGPTPGWSDAKSQHKNCAYMWLDWIASPEVQAQVAEWFGEAPANAKACDFTSKGFCDDYHVTDAAYARPDLVLDDADQAVPRRAYRRPSARRTRTGRTPGRRSRAEPATTGHR